MKKTLFTIISDTLFCFIISFVLAFTFVKKITYPYSLILAISISAVFSLIIFALLKRKRIKNYNIKIDNKEMEKACFYMSILQKNQLINLFVSAYNNTNYAPIRQENFISLSNGDKVFLCFSPDGLKKSDVVRCFNQLNKEEKGTIYYFSANNDVLAYAKNFKRIVLLDKISAYAFLTKNKVYPKENQEISSIVRGAKLSNLFIKKHAKKHFLFGVSFYFLSFISLLKTYYLIVGTIFLIFSMICLILGNAEKLED